MATDGTTTIEGIVPGWDGDHAKWPTYLLKALLYVRGTKKSDRGTCAARLMQRLTGTAWGAVEAYPHGDTLEAEEEVDADDLGIAGKLVEGVHKLLSFLQEKCHIEPIDDAGQRLEEFFNMKRHRGESMGDYINRLEKSHDQMITAVKKVSATPENVQAIDRTILAWWLLKRAGLDEMQKSVVVSSAGNKYDWAKVTTALRAQWTKARTDTENRSTTTSKPFSGQRRQPIFFQINEDGAEQEDAASYHPEEVPDRTEDNGEQDTNWYDIPEEETAIVALAEQGGDEEAGDEYLEGAILAAMGNASRSFRLARELTR